MSPCFYRYNSLRSTPKSPPWGSCQGSQTSSHPRDSGGGPTTFRQSHRHTLCVCTPKILKTERRLRGEVTRETKNREGKGLSTLEWKKTWTDSEKCEEYQGSHTNKDKNEVERKRSDSSGVPVLDLKGDKIQGSHTRSGGRRTWKVKDSVCFFY